jgi:hypothetical protein
MITRGTTPYHTFVLPLSVDSISELYITYLQNKEVLFEKSLSSGDITIEDATSQLENASMEDLQNEEGTSESAIKVHLTQEDTLKFKFYPAAEKNIAVIQIRVLTSDGEAYASNPIEERLFGVLKDGIIGE